MIMRLWIDFLEALKLNGCLKNFTTLNDEAETDVLECIIRYYNVARGHSYNNYLSPNAAEKLILTY